MAEVVEAPKPAGSSASVRVFDDLAIQTAVSKALSTVPAGKTGAVVAFVDQSKEVRLAVAAKIGDHWSIAAEAKKPYQKPIEGHAAVVFVW